MIGPSEQGKHAGSTQTPHHLFFEFLIFVFFDNSKTLPRLFEEGGFDGSASYVPKISKECKLDSENERFRLLLVATILVLVEGFVV